MLRSPLKSSGIYRLSIEWHYNRRFKGQLLYRIFFFTMKTLTEDTKFMEKRR